MEMLLRLEGYEVIGAASRDWGVYGFVQIGAVSSG